MLKLEVISSVNMADTAFTAFCVLKTVDFFNGTVKTLRLVCQEFHVKDIESEMSYFDDDDDDDDDDDHHHHHYHHYEVPNFIIRQRLDQLDR